MDYIIVGQGLAGSALAWELMGRGKRVKVYDLPGENRASIISAGICNPITGKVMTRTFLADLLFPFLNQWYPQAERKLGRSFFYPKPIYRPFLSLAEQQQWKEKSAAVELRDFVTKVCDTSPLPGALNDPHGGLLIRQSGYLDVVSWVATIRDALKEQGAWTEEYFDEKECRVDDAIHYKGVTASQIVLCNGLAARNSQWFGWLPLRPLKGEALVVKMEMDNQNIVSRGVYLVPGRDPGTFIAGSTYQHEPYSLEASEEGREQILTRLKKLVRNPFEIIHQGWGIRPTVTDRRPLMGSHPDHENVIIFNGLGTKGVSLAPYFAKLLADWSEGGPSLPAEVNISRFKPLYSK